MTRKEIREEVIASGAENIAGDTGGEARLNRWIQETIRDICDHKPWPFLFASKEGAAPLEIADLGHVIAVADISNRNPLEPITVNQIQIGDPNMDAAGGAEFWFTEDNKTIKVYPSGAGATYRVDYRKVPAALTDEEEPIIPKDYHDLIVVGTRRKAYKYTDNFAAAAEEKADYEDGLQGMEHALLKPNYDKERRITRQGYVGDYL